MNSILLFHLNNLTWSNRTVQRSKWFLMAEKSLIRSDTSSSAIACNWPEEKNCLFSKRVLNNLKIKILTEVLNLDKQVQSIITKLLIPRIGIYSHFGADKTVFWKKSTSEQLSIQKWNFESLIHFKWIYVPLYHHSYKR